MRRDLDQNKQRTAFWSMCNKVSALSVLMIRTIQTKQTFIMKKILTLAALMLAIVLPTQAQKFALIDMEYILQNVPAYERANEQLNQVSKKWQAEVEAVDEEAKTLYKNYQNEIVFLSDTQKKEREQAIVNKEKEAAELKRKYFGPEGELFKKRQSLIQPLQDEVYEAVKSVATQKGFQLILDRASETAGIIFATPSIDVSNEVLPEIGLCDKLNEQIINKYNKHYGKKNPFGVAPARPHHNFRSKVCSLRPPSYGWSTPCLQNRNDWTRNAR